MFGLNKLFGNNSVEKEYVPVTNEEFLKKNAKKIKEQIKYLNEKYLLNKPVKRKIKFRPKNMNFNKFIANVY